jgi:hypothetical protein
MKRHKFVSITPGSKKCAVCGLDKNSPAAVHYTEEPVGDITMKGML